MALACNTPEASRRKISRPVDGKAPPSARSVKRVLLLHFPNLNNYGTAMMGLNVLQGLHDEGGEDWEYLCDFSPDFDPTSVSKELCGADWRVGRYDFPLALSPPSNRWLFALWRADRLLRAKRFKAADAVIVLGGDDFSEDYGFRHVRRELWKIYFCSLRCPVILMGQTIGPFQPSNQALVCSCLGRCHLYPRDPWTVDYLHRELDLPRAKLTGDLAWLDLPRQHQAGLFQETAASCGLEKRRYVSLIVSGLQQKFHPDPDVYLRAFHDLVSALLRKRELAGCKICLLPHTVRRPYGDERELIRRIAASFTLEERARIAAVDDRLGPTRTRLLLGNGLFTVSGRMHAAISTFQMGQPAVALSYSVKFRGVIGDSLGRGDLIVDATDRTLWENGALTPRVMERVDYLLANRSRLQAEIVVSVARQKELARNMICETARIIRDSP
jgi:colanic acid/amylovoran biosynthesis protein